MFKLLERQQRRRDGEALIVGGRSFHVLAAAAGKARSPSVERRADGTTADTVLAVDTHLRFSLIFPVRITIRSNRAGTDRN